MGKTRRGAATATLALLGLAGCAAVDSFSSRAITYNQQAETIKESQLMLNVMRAAYREPLQFSDFTQVTGQATVSGTAAFTLPFNANPPTFGRADTASPAATISGTQAFTVANLDTQEFYEGILSPIPITSIDYYIEQGFPKALLLTLVTGRIELDVQGTSPKVFYNNYYLDNFKLFESAVAALVALGLDSEVAKDVTNIGPPLTAGQIASLRALAPIAGEDTALKRFTPATDPDITPSERAVLARQGISEYFRLQSTTEQSRFCIEPDQQDFAAATRALVAAGVLAEGQSIVGPAPPPAGSAAAEAAAAQKCGAPSYVRMLAAERRGYSEPQNRFSVQVREPTGALTTLSFSVDFTIRSVEGIIYYLGELARGELDIGVPNALPVPQVETGLGGDRLFAVRRDCLGAAGEIDTVYSGTRYCIGIDPSGRDRSSEVMEIVLQLLALNTSAKTLPAPSVITVLGQ